MSQKREILQKRKNEFLEEIRRKLLYLLVFLSPNQLIKHFWPSWSFVFGIRVDYLSISISLTELLILIIFILWFLEIVFFDRLKEKVRFNWWFLVLIILFLSNIIFSGFSLNTIISWAKFFLLFWLSYYLIFWNKESFFEWFFKPASLSLFFFGLIGVLQFIKGSTTDSFLYFLGERNFSKNTAGIALFSFLGRDFLRVYSTFPHPNVLAGFFGLCLILLLGTEVKSGFCLIWKKIILVFGFFVFLLSFSRGAFLSLLLVGFVLLINKKYLRIVAFLMVSLSFLFSLILFFLSDLNRNNIYLSKPLKERLDLVISTKDVFLKYPFFGVGLNNFILKTSYNFEVGAINYQLQPVHNIYLLVLSELGVFGFLIFYLFLLRISLIASSLNKPWFFLGLCFVIISGVVDHYWLTLGQTRLLFVILVSQIIKESYGRKNYC
ncbi:MAG: hypothetical protein KatS3mg088_139 [Patescibacteria group bacterium]|nr:MAG: hypothetical protein KatS3mg088_139 [Patescibacteria group bacterium]